MSYIESYNGVNPTGDTDVMSKVYIDAPATVRLEYGIPCQGTYTLQFYIKSATNLDIELLTGKVKRYITTTTEWVKYVYTFNISDTNDNAILFDLPAGLYYLYHVKLEQGVTASNWTPAIGDGQISSIVNGSPLYKIDDKYMDKLGCDNGVWYIERNTELITLDGTEDWLYHDSFYILTLTRYGMGDSDRYVPALSSHFIYDGSSAQYGKFNVLYHEGELWVRIGHEGSEETMADFIEWLGENNVKLLLPADSTRVTLANYLQDQLNSMVMSGDLSVSFSEDNVGSMTGAVLIEPIVFGTLNEDMTALINNASDDAIGFIYQLHCKGEVTNPAIYLTETNEHIKLTGRFKLDDTIVIDTRRGKKSITKIYRGESTNIINKLDNTSSWLQLQSGFNHITQTADSGADLIESVIIYTNEYEGV